jgi:hypothetical protein
MVCLSVRAIRHPLRSYGEHRSEARSDSCGLHLFDSFTGHALSRFATLARATTGRGRMTPICSRRYTKDPLCVGGFATLSYNALRAEVELKRTRSLVVGKYSRSGSCLWPPGSCQSRPRLRLFLPPAPPLRACTRTRPAAHAPHYDQECGTAAIVLLCR